MWSHRTGRGGVDSATANPHLNVFDPYRDLGRTHEDQLTRAAMIVLRLVPLARETLLRAIGEPSQSELPDCTVDMQATHIVDASEECASGGEVKRGRLVSVFLTPDTEAAEPDGEVRDTSRGQRFDGVLRFDPELVVLLESKVCTRWARRNGHRVGELNLGSARFAQRRTCVLRWHDLLESWWRLVELGGALPRRARARAGHARVRPPGLRASAAVRLAAARRRGPRAAQVAAALAAARIHRPAPERIGLAHVRLDTALGTVTDAARGARLRRAGAATAHVAGRAQAPGRPPLRLRPRRAPRRAPTGRGASGRGAWSPSRSSASATPPPAPASTSRAAWTPPPTCAAGRARTSSRWAPTTPTRSSPSCGRGCCAAATPPPATKRAWRRSCARSGAAPRTCVPPSTCPRVAVRGGQPRSTTRACSRGRSATRSTCVLDLLEEPPIPAPAEAGAPVYDGPPPETAGAARSSEVSSA